MRVITETASARVARYAARLALQRQQAGRGPGKVTVVSKRNVLPRTDGLFCEQCDQAVAQVPSLEVSHLYVDEAARRLASAPEQFDVIVTTNLFGDILSDIASEMGGGLPLAPSASVGDAHAYFEPVHGSAPDLVDPQRGNPIGAILSAAMLLTYLGEHRAAGRIESGVAATLAADIRPFQLGGTASADQFAQALCRTLDR
jgi:isocitrate/isopropylmalate dehydrogenase